MSHQRMATFLMLWAPLIALMLIPAVWGLECFQCVDILDEEMRNDLGIETSSLCNGASVTTPGLMTKTCGITEKCVSVRGLAQVKRRGDGYRTSVPIIGRTCWRNDYQTGCDDINYSQARDILADVTGRDVPQFREGNLCYCESDRCSLDCPGAAYPQIGSYCVDWWVVLLVVLAVVVVLVALGCVCYRCCCRNKYRL